MLVERFQNMVYGLALSILRRREDAEEAAQDTFLKLYRARDSFDEAKSLEPWLLRIAGNASRDKLRRRRVAEVPQLRSPDDSFPDLPDPRSTAAQIERQQEQDAVRGALAGLSDKVRLPLELKYLRGLTNAQIAAALEVSVSNVKVQIARGKDVLASRLADVTGVTRGGVAERRDARPSQQARFDARSRQDGLGSRRRRDHGGDA